MVVENLPLGSTYLLFVRYALIRMDHLIHISRCLEGIDLSYRPQRGLIPMPFDFFNGKKFHSMFL